MRRFIPESTKRKAEAVGDFVWRAAMHLSRSPLLTVGARRWALRQLGFDLPFLGKINAGTYIGSRLVSFGQYFQSNIDCYFDGSSRLHFGNYVTVGAKVSIITATHSIGPAEHRRDWDDIPRPVTVGDGCWIGFGAIIVGVDIAPGCVIAAGAIVTKPTEPNGLYAGAPARRIRDL